jgi:hypothetical protein
MKGCACCLFVVHKPVNLISVVAVMVQVACDLESNGGFGGLLGTHA